MDYSDIAKLNKLAHRGGKEPTSFGEYLLIGLFVVIFLAVVGVPLIVYFVWSHALVIKTFWAWFVVSTFDMKPLTWPQAWGLSMIVSYLTHVTFTWKAEDTRENSAKIAEFVMLFLKPWIALGVGYICAHYFMHVV